MPTPSNGSITKRRGYTVIRTRQWGRKPASVSQSPRSSKLGENGERLLTARTVAKRTYGK